jgi:hypothetical protein
MIELPRRKVEPGTSRGLARSANVCAHSEWIPAPRRVRCLLSKSLFVWRSGSQVWRSWMCARNETGSKEHAKDAVRANHARGEVLMTRKGEFDAQIRTPSHRAHAVVPCGKSRLVSIPCTLPAMTSRKTQRPNIHACKPRRPTHDCLLLASAAGGTAPNASNSFSSRCACSVDCAKHTTRHK